jgi:hypothetical protein
LIPGLTTDSQASLGFLTVMDSRITPAGSKFFTSPTLPDFPKKVREGQKKRK